MAAANFAQALALVLVHEGGKSDDPHDPGGRTNWGITHTDYDAYRNSKGLPLQDVYLMTPQERDEIYKTRYWDPVRGDDLPSGLDYVVFDGGVNSGIGQSVKWLQRALPALPANGRMDQALITTAGQVADMATLIEACCEARREFLQNLSTFQYFGRGWIKRVDDVQSTALIWAAGTTPPLPASAPATTSQPKALRESGSPLPSTAPGDVTAAASAAGIAAALIAHNQAASSTPAASSATPLPGATPPAPAANPPGGQAGASSAPGAPAPPSAATGPAAPPSAAPTGPAPAGPAPAAPTPSSPIPATQAPMNPSSGPATVAPAKPAAPVTPAAGPSSAAPAAKPAPAPVPAVKPATGPSLLNPPVKIPGSQAHPGQATATPPPAGTTSVAPPAPKATHIVGITDSFFPVTLLVLGAVFLFGLYLAFSSRGARARRADALGDNPVPTTALKIGKYVVSTLATHTASAPAHPAPTPANITSIPLVQNIWARVASVLWILGTIVVNVIALAKLLQGFGFAHEDWHQPLIWLSSVYDNYAGQAFNVTAASVHQQFHFGLPAWIMPLFVLYVSSASAFVVASTGLMRRNTTGETLFGAIIHAGWIFAVPSFVMDAIRYHVVARFAKQNTVLFFAYLFALVVAYVGARFVNDDILSGISPKAQAAAMSAISQSAADATKISHTLGGH